MSFRVPAVLVAVVLTVSACSDVVGPPDVPTTDLDSAAASAHYNPNLQPAAAVMALVPTSATRLRVTDYDAIRSGAAKAPVLTDVLLRPVDATLHADYGFGLADVSWEAQWTGPDGDGWAIRLDDSVRGTGPQDAIDQKVGPLRGATYYPGAHVLLDGGTVDPATSWVAEPALTSLVGAASASTYVQRDCVPLDVAFAPGLASRLSDTSAAEVASLQDLAGFAVGFGETVATVRVGLDREDVDTRADLADHLPRTHPEFGLGFTDPVSDPDTGRIGYLVVDPRIAARLVLSDQVPFAVCASPQPAAPSDSQTAAVP